jgi:hypothetical protein
MVTLCQLVSLADLLWYGQRYFGLQGEPTQAFRVHPRGEVGFSKQEQLARVHCSSVAVEID